MYKPIKHLSQRQKRYLVYLLLSLIKSELPDTSHDAAGALDNSVFIGKTSPDECQNLKLIQCLQITLIMNLLSVKIINALYTKSECINPTSSKTKQRTDLKQLFIECNVRLNNICEFKC